MIMVNEKSKSFQYCPCCGGSRITQYPNSIDCLDCHLEFDKTDLNLIEDKDLILSVKEKLDVAKLLKNMGIFND